MEDSVTAQEDNSPVEALDTLTGVEKEHVDDILNDKQQILPIPPEIEHKQVGLILGTLDQDILDRDMEGEDVLDSILENLLKHVIGPHT